MPTRIIYWFRNDLRLDDNEAFWNAVRDADEIVPVYVFDPRRFRVRGLGFRKTGINRANHILRGVANLREQMQEAGAGLIVSVGEPEMVVSELARRYEVAEVRASKEITLEETNIEASLSKKLKGINVDISLTWMSTLIHPHDLPFYVSRLPGSFSLFADLVRPIPIRKPVGRLAFKQVLTDQGESTLPGLKDLGFTGKEVAGNTGNQAVCQTEEELKTALANEALEAGELLNLVSFGLVSPREAFHLASGTKAGEELLPQLLWRDYLQFVALRYGTRLFKPSGLIHKIDKTWEYDREAFYRWREGETADETVNTYMKKLRTSGNLEPGESYTVARYLIEEMGVNWTWGASWFESCLNSYEVALNWGNWNYFAGVGPGAWPGEKATQDDSVQHGNQG